MYKNTNSFYLMYIGGSKQKLKEITQWGTNLFVLFVYAG